MPRKVFSSHLVNVDWPTKRIVRNFISSELFSDDHQLNVALVNAEWDDIFF